jgi:hypothetical protein
MSKLERETGECENLTLSFSSGFSLGRIKGFEFSPGLAGLQTLMIV